MGRGGEPKCLPSGSCLRFVIHRDPRDRYNNCKLLAIRERSVPVESTSWAALAPALLLGLREGLEAALILGLVFGILRRTGNLGYARYVWAGAAAAGTLSLAVAAVLLVVGRGLEGSGGAVFGGALQFLAAAPL